MEFAEDCPSDTWTSRQWRAYLANLEIEANKFTSDYMDGIMEPNCLEVAIDKSGWLEDDDEKTPLSQQVLTFPSQVDFLIIKGLWNVLDTVFDMLMQDTKPLKLTPQQVHKIFQLYSRLRKVEENLILAICCSVSEEFEQAEIRLKFVLEYLNKEFTVILALESGVASNRAEQLILVIKQVIFDTRSLTFDIIQENKVEANQ